MKRIAPITLVRGDVVRLRSKMQDDSYGLGIVKYNTPRAGAYHVEFQGGIIDVFLPNVIRIGTRRQVIQHLTNMIDCTVNPVNDPNCGLQDNYCNDDDCDCNICPFNTAPRSKCPNCIENKYRTAWYYEPPCDVLVENMKQAFNFIMKHDYTNN